MDAFLSCSFMYSLMCCSFSVSQRIQHFAAQWSPTLYVEVQRNPVKDFGEHIKFYLQFLTIRNNGCSCAIKDMTPFFHIILGGLSCCFFSIALVVTFICTKVAENGFTVLYASDFGLHYGDQVFLWFFLSLIYWTCTWNLLRWYFLKRNMVKMPQWFSISILLQLLVMIFPSWLNRVWTSKAGFGHCLNSQSSISENWSMTSDSPPFLSTSITLESTDNLNTGWLWAVTESPKVPHRLGQISLSWKFRHTAFVVKPLS